MGAMGQGDWSIRPNFVYNPITGLIHEVKFEAAVPPAAQDPVVSSSEVGAVGSSTSPSKSRDTCSVSQTSASTSGSSESPAVPLLPPSGLSTKQQIEFLQNVGMIILTSPPSPYVNGCFFQQIAKLQEKMEKEEKEEKVEKEEPEVPKEVPSDIRREPVGALPSNWKATQDQEGNTYYYNVETR